MTDGPAALTRPTRGGSRLMEDLASPAYHTPMLAQLRVIVTERDSAVWYLAPNTVFNIAGGPLTALLGLALYSVVFAKAGGVLVAMELNGTKGRCAVPLSLARFSPRAQQRGSNSARGHRQRVVVRAAAGW